MMKSMKGIQDVSFRRSGRMTHVSSSADDRILSMWIIKRGGFISLSVVSKGRQLQT
jgi:hypothetical protein